MIFINKHTKEHFQNRVIREENKNRTIVMDKIFTVHKLDNIYETEYGLNNELNIL